MLPSTSNNKMKIRQPGGDIEAAVCYNIRQQLSGPAAKGNKRLEWKNETKL